VTPTLIWCDAHGDFNTWETTPSGFLGGMPLAMAVGRGEQTIAAGVGLAPLPAGQVILTDARDLDPGEREAVAESELTHLPQAADLLEYPLPAGPLYVHFDVDVLDPEAAPAMNYPAPGGPDAATMGRVFDRLADTGRIVAVSLSAWNPEMDENGRTQQVVLALLHRLLAAPGGK
jgi:arginase